MEPRLEIDVAAVCEAYGRGEPAASIAAGIGCSLWILHDRLGEAGIRLRDLPRFPVQEAAEHYRSGEKLIELGRRYGLAPQTIRRHLVELGVEIRSVLDSQQPRGRTPCPNVKSLRAYLLGFAIGDMYVRRPNERGHTIEVGCSTTHPEQVALVRATFGRFGPVRTSGTTVRTSLGPSFAFLLQKYAHAVPEWIPPRPDPVAAAFAAGYIDAEGSFGVYGGRARFKVDAYDDHVLDWLAAWCRAVGVRCKHQRVGEAGAARSDGTRFNADLWRVTVNEAGSLLRLIATLDPFLFHARRRSAAERARSNVLERLGARVHPVPPAVHLCGGARGSREDHAE